MSSEVGIDYQYQDLSPSHTNAYLWDPVFEIIKESDDSRVFDLGCGNGAFARHLKSLGCSVEGVDPSTEGIERAQKTDPSLRLEVGSAYEPLSDRFGSFPVVTSLEVVEHLYSPRIFSTCVRDLLEPGGIAIISTPYHGYLKNLALAFTGKMDSHFTALWDHGHIKFWSAATLTQLFDEVGLTREGFLRVGRFPTLAKSMVLVFRKPVN